MSTIISTKLDGDTNQSNEVSMSPIETLNGMPLEKFKSVLANVSIQRPAEYPGNTGESTFNYVVFEFDKNMLNDSNVTLKDAKSAILALFWQNAQIGTKRVFNEKQDKYETRIVVQTKDDTSPLTYHEVPKDNLTISEKENELVLAILGQDQKQRTSDFIATQAKLGEFKRRFGV